MLTPAIVRYAISVLLVTFVQHAVAADEQPMQRILFGSCIKQDQPLPIFRTMLQEDPQLLILLGDNIYANTTDMAVMRAKYQTLASNKNFDRLRKACPVLAVWDDHDYGINDSGADFPQRAAAQQEFVRFWDVGVQSPRQNRPGIYDVRTFGPQGRRVQVILLDVRYFRSPLAKGEKRVGGPYVPDDDPAKTMLGDAQWKWLEEQLRQPADVRLIASGTQVLAEAAGQETWANLPHERDRLFRLILATNAGGVLMLSGDRHWSEISALTPSTEKEKVSYPLYDVTSSSFNQIHPRGTPTVNRFRVIDQTYHRPNYGLLDIDWSADDPTLAISIRDIDGKPQIEKRLTLSELRP